MVINEKDAPSERPYIQCINATSSHLLIHPSIRHHAGSGQSHAKGPIGVGRNGRRGPMGAAGIAGQVSGQAGGSKPGQIEGAALS